MHDLLAVEVNDPTGVSHAQDLGVAEKAALLPIQPIPLQPLVRREGLLRSALLLSIVQFPHEHSRRVAEHVDFTIGLRLLVGVCQGEVLLHLLPPLISMHPVQPHSIQNCCWLVGGVC